MANVHAYKTVYALKEIAEDIMYSPEDILTDEKSGETIIKEGFRILLQAQCTEQEVRDLIGVGYDIEKVEVYECDANQFLLGFDFGDQAPAPQIDLESSVETIEEKQEEKQKEGAQEKKEEKPKIVPGDFVIQSKEPGKQKKLAKDKPKGEKASFISVNVSKMDQLMDLIGELVISESVVLQSSDLKVPGLNLDNFNKAAA